MINKFIVKPNKSVKEIIDINTGNAFIIFAFLCAVIAFPGCSSIKVVESGDINCLDFAQTYASIEDSTIVFGIYKPVKGVFHAWVIDKDGRCQDQMRIFKCNDPRYKAISVPSDDELIVLNRGKV